MGYFLLALLFFSPPAFSQKTPITFLEDRCEFKTDGSGKSVGLKIMIKYPCSWSQADGDRPHVLKKFSYKLGSGKTLAQSLTIIQLATEPSKQEIAETFTLAGLKELVSTTGTFVSGRKVKIDGIDCGCIFRRK